MTAAAYPFPEKSPGDIEARNKSDGGSARTPTWKGKLWDTFDLPPAERRLLFKVDAVILTFASVSEMSISESEHWAEPGP